MLLPETGRLVTGSLDGSLTSFELVRDSASGAIQPGRITRHLEQTNASSGITAICTTDDGFVTALTNGTVLRFKHSGEVKSVRLASDRVACIAFDTSTAKLAAGDWAGGIHTVCNGEVEVDHLPPFILDDQERVNSVLCMSIYNGTLFVGSSDGCVRGFDLAARVSVSQPAFSFKAHSHAVRSIEPITRDMLQKTVPGSQNAWDACYLSGHPLLVTSGNDGIAAIAYPTGDTYAVTPFSSCQTAGQFLYRTALVAVGARLLAAVVGNDIQMYVYDITALVSADSACVFVAESLPLAVEAWDVVPVPCEGGARFLVALDNGTALVATQQSEDGTGLALRQHQKYLHDSFQALATPASRVTGVHSSIVRPSSVHCPSLSMLTSQCSPSKPMFAGAIMACNIGSEVCIVTCHNRAWVRHSRIVAPDTSVTDPAGRTWDLALPVVGDMSEQSYTCYLNADEDAEVVAERFVRESGVADDPSTDPADFRRQVADFVIKNKPTTRVLPEFQCDCVPKEGYLLCRAVDSSSVRAAIARFYGAYASLPCPKPISQTLASKCAAILAARDADTPNRVLLTSVLSEYISSGITRGMVDDAPATVAMFSDALADANTRVAGAALVVMCYLLLHCECPDTFHAGVTNLFVTKLECRMSSLTLSFDRPLATFLFRLAAILAAGNNSGGEVLQTIASCKAFKGEQLLITLQFIADEDLACILHSITDSAMEAAVSRAAVASSKKFPLTIAEIDRHRS